MVDGEVLFRIKVSLDHPVDLYALMDLTGSMGTHKKNLGIAAQAIADALSDKTRYYRFAYGSFRDKPRPPFGSGNLFKNSFNYGQNIFLLSCRGHSYISNFLTT